MDQHVAGRPAHVGRESVIPAQRTGPADDPSRTRANVKRASFKGRTSQKTTTTKNASPRTNSQALLTGAQAKTQGRNTTIPCNPDQSMDRNASRGACARKLALSRNPWDLRERFAIGSAASRGGCGAASKTGSGAGPGITAGPAAEGAVLQHEVGHAFARVQPATRAP